jgi:hypothetical protein
MWDYLMRNWLRLAARVEADSNRTRWSNHALWDLLAAVQWNEMPQPTLTRIRASGLPRDEQIFTAFPGYIASYMAREGITDWGEGLGGALHEAEKFHFLQGRQLASYAEEKARVKGRLLSTINNRINNREDRKRIHQEAEEYRRARNGEDGDGTDADT